MLTSLSPKNRRGLVSKWAALAIALCAFAITAKAEAVSIIGNGNESLATATLSCTFNAQTNTFTFTLANTSPFDARITGVGFDLIAGDFSNGSGLNGFSGANVGNFTFTDDALGNIPQLGNAVLDFGFITGNSGNFSGGSPNNGIAPGGSLIFTVSGTAFSGLTEAQICNAVFVRFQRVGPDGEGSDVGRVTHAPEPATMLLLGSGLVGVAGFLRKKFKAQVSDPSSE